MRNVILESWVLPFGLSFAVMCGGAPQLLAQTTEMISVNNDGDPAGGITAGAAVSADARFVVFDSAAGNLGLREPSVDFYRQHIYLRDRLTGITHPITKNLFGVAGNFPSHHADVSDDGRFVVFDTWAANLVFVDEENFLDVIAYDRELDTMIYVSGSFGGVAGNNDSTFPSISGDGRFVAFTSAASNLVAGDTNGTPDIFVHDLVDGTIEKVSKGSGTASRASISKDGRFVSYTTTSSLDPADQNGDPDIYVLDRATGIHTLVSVAMSGDAGNKTSDGSSISADGTRVAFESKASDLVPGDSNGVTDVFLRDLVLGTTVRVSVSSAGDQANGESSFTRLSSDGTHVAFQSKASNLVAGAGDTNGVEDVFLHDLIAGTTERVSLGSDGQQPLERSNGAAVSGDGQFVAFGSEDDDLVPQDNNGHCDVFLRGPSASLCVDADQKVESDVVEFTTFLGGSGGISLLFAVEVNGIWDLTRLDLGTLDSEGRRTRSFVTPPGLGGLTITFQGFCQNDLGQFVATNTVCVEFL